MDRLLYPVPEACERLGIGKSRFYEEVGAGRIRTVKSGAKTLVPRDELVRYPELLKAEAGWSSEDTQPAA